MSTLDGISVKHESAGSNQRAPTEGKRKPAKGYAPGDGMFETQAFAKRTAKRRAAAKAAKAARRKNRK